MTKLMIALTVLFSIVAWVLMIALAVHINLELQWKFYIGGFGGSLILVLGGWLCQNLAMSDKKRHATPVKSNTRFLRANT